VSAVARGVSAVARGMPRK